MYDVLLDTYNMKYAMQIVPSAKFEHRKEKQKLPVFLDAYGRSLSKCVETVWHVSHSGQVITYHFFLIMKLSDEFYLARYRRSENSTSSILGTS